MLAKGMLAAGSREMTQVKTVLLSKGMTRASGCSHQGMPALMTELLTLWGHCQRAT